METRMIDAPPVTSLAEAGLPHGAALSCVPCGDANSLVRARPIRLPSWNDGPAKQAIVDVRRRTTTDRQPGFRSARGAHRDLRPGRHAVGRASDVHAGGLCLDRVPVAGKARSRSWKDNEPFKTVLSGDREAIAKLSMKRPREDRGRHPDRHESTSSSRRDDWLATAQAIRAGSGPTPSWSTSRCSRC